MKPAGRVPVAAWMAGSASLEPPNLILDHSGKHPLGVRSARRERSPTPRRASTKVRDTVVPPGRVSPELLPEHHDEGRWTRTAVPSPATLSTWMSPPYAFTIDWQ